jgi:hypothetical protein
MRIALVSCKSPTALLPEHTFMILFSIHLDIIVPLGSSYLKASQQEFFTHLILLLSMLIGQPIPNKNSYNIIITKNNNNP